jgi:hypothetical protein
MAMASRPTACSRKIVADLPAIRRRLSLYADLSVMLAEVPRDMPRTDDGRPFWRTIYLPVIDATSICGMIREFRPERFVEIGSGHSTRFARHAIDALGLPCEIVSIDPYPGDTVSARSDRLIQQALEGTDLTLFDSLQPGDIVWMDGTHRSFSNTDVTVFCFDVLPRLPPGVIVGVHDITLPWDYPPSWDRYYFSENFVVGAYLLGALDRVELLFPSLYINHINRKLRSLLSPLWQMPALAPPLDELGGGGAFWFRLVAQPFPRVRRKIATSILAIRRAIRMSK